MERLDIYREKINIPVEDYKTLLTSDPNENLLKYDLFKEYKKSV